MADSLTRLSAKAPRAADDSRYTEYSASKTASAGRLRKIRRFGPVAGAARIEIIGHADRAEEADRLADEISRRRAETVGDYLVSMGVDPAIFETRGVGASDPFTATGEGVREPTNRRVEVMIYYR